MVLILTGYSNNGRVHIEFMLLKTLS